METTAAWELIWICCNRSSGCKDTCDAGVQVDGEEENERASRGHILSAPKPVDLASFNGVVTHTGVLRPVVGEPPTECLRVDPLCIGYIEHGKFDAIDVMVSM